jgi:hypothetical protein
MSVAELKAMLINEIEHADEGSLFELQNLLLDPFELPDYVIKRIEVAQNEAIEGKGISHEEVMKLSKTWLKK